MRPLPSFEPLPPQPSVYDPQQDSFLSVLANQFDQLDKLNSSMSGEVDSALGYESGIGGSIDALDSTLSEAISAFDLLQAEDTAIDLTGMIADAFSLDNQLVSNFDSWGPDIGSLAASFISQIFGGILRDLGDYLRMLFQTFMQEIQAWVQMYVTAELASFGSTGAGGGR